MTVALLAVLFIASSVYADEASIARGKRLFVLANCYSCHTDSDNEGKPLAGGRELKTPFGVFVTPNITPDAETGIGGWSVQQFIDALSKGLSPSGDHYFPVFPYTAYSAMRRRDMRDLYDYLMTRPAVTQRNPPHRLKWFVSRHLMGVWKRLNRWQNPPRVNADRGAYIVNALAHCGECHTPRNALGILDNSRYLKGNEQLEAPDISAANRDGIRQWSDDELKEFFSDGLYPDGDYVGGEMAEVIDQSSQNWSEQDLNAVTGYLRRVK